MLLAGYGVCGNAPILFGFDPCCFHQRSVLRHFTLEELDEPVRRTANDIGALTGGVVLELWRGNYLQHGGVQPINNVSRCTGRHQ